MYLLLVPMGQRGLDILAGSGLPGLGRHHLGLRHVDRPAQAPPNQPRGTVQPGRAGGGSGRRDAGAWRGHHALAMGRYRPGRGGAGLRAVGWVGSQRQIARTAQSLNASTQTQLLWRPSLCASSTAEVTSIFLKMLARMEYGARGNAKMIGDVLVVASVDQLIEHLALTRTQRGQRLAHQLRLLALVTGDRGRSQRLFNPVHQHVVLKRFFQEVPGPILDRRHRHADIAVAGQKTAPARDRPGS